jgi:hypothetical protein
MSGRGMLTTSAWACVLCALVVVVVLWLAVAWALA